MYIIGPYGVESTASYNGERLVSFACAITGCASLTHSSQTDTSTKPLGTHPTLVDHPASWILVKPRLLVSVLDTKVFRGADIDSDHHLEIMSVRLKLQKKHKEKHFDVKLLQGEPIKADFINTFTNCFD